MSVNDKAEEIPYIELYADHINCEEKKHKILKIFDIKNVVATPIARINLNSYRSFDKLKFENIYRMAKKEGIDLRVKYDAFDLKNRDEIKSILSLLD